MTIRQLRRFHPSEDVPGDRAHAEPMTLGHPITGTINTAEDSDCFRFEAVPGHVYAYSITGGGFRLFDVTDAEGTPIDGPTTVIRPPTGGPAYWCWSVRPPPYVTGPFVYTFNITDLGVLPDDLGNTRVDAAASTLPATLAGTMDYAGDTDAFGITATSGERCYAEALTPGMTLSLERLGWARYFEPHALSVGVPEAFVPGSLQATPGHATIFFSATSSSSTGSAFAVRVWRACPADITRPGHAGVVDGVVNTEDISYFLDAFLNARSPADIAGPGMAESPDGDFTNDDLALYITRYFMGCP